MVKDVNKTYCGSHFTIYTNIKSLCYIPETNIMLYVNYTSIKKYVKGDYSKSSSSYTDLKVSCVFFILPASVDNLPPAPHLFAPITVSFPQILN